MQANLVSKQLGKPCGATATRCNAVARMPLRVNAVQAAKGASAQDTVEARREHARAAMQWFRVPPKIYFKGGCLEVALNELANEKKRAFIVTDKKMLDMEYTDKVTRILDTINVHHQVFYHVGKEATLSAVNDGLREISEFRPDVIIAIGGGSPMDAAKAMWLMYEQPNATFEQLVGAAQNVRQRVNDSATLGSRALCICIPTTSGTGAEVTPFSVIKDERTGRKHTLADYSLTPSMAVLDPQLVIQLPAAQTAYGGMATLAHAIESYISVFASDYSRGLSKHAMTMMSRYYGRAYKNGAMDYHAREKMHNAATVAGMAMANTFLGAAHALAAELAVSFDINIGLAYGLVITPVLKFMLKDPATADMVGELADHLHLGGFNTADKCDHVLSWIDAQKAAANIPVSIKDALGSSQEAIFSERVGTLVQNALDDANMVASPRTPTAADLTAMLMDAWAGK
mmetsp:Transcript_23327/g.59687  ORF Transcript_23327/g.59687 Transcript_23327/m.59687 type:complete len:458 (-) Transcript_23327:483-1856(-)|eukprot:CAMPEP_0202869268 /NCGR_PEP_ID=MMETSP1391-20130828/12308_1 /ASSEMBLY_ACC=CAM_ASM_000867 /TAXON_ID=1034604 /ORGANISM="Chlamydomonas leiostraca, Strain SAG 11-49" /LENGTH=457 /DNA_ID=CAMNT_0049549567 /DNA_START=81 /DNA_END=1454 /DNA_ORIENTATION=+